MPEIKTSSPTFSALIFSSVKGNESLIINNQVKCFQPQPWRELNPIIPCADAALSAWATHGATATFPLWKFSRAGALEESNQSFRAFEILPLAPPFSPPRHRSKEIVRHAHQAPPAR